MKNSLKITLAFVFIVFIGGAAVLFAYGRKEDAIGAAIIGGVVIAAGLIASRFDRHGR